MSPRSFPPARGEKSPAGDDGIDGSRVATTREQRGRRWRAGEDGSRYLFSHFFLLFLFFFFFFFPSRFLLNRPPMVAFWQYPSVATGPRTDQLPDRTYRAIQGLTLGKENLASNT
ncbi:hypothetical protein BHE74_00032639 [Ensete ventricosum]|nr:hypothetical protein BHE74_00032639 [Ensete ventricosum]